MKSNESKLEQIHQQIIQKLNTNWVNIKNEIWFNFKTTFHQQSFTENNINQNIIKQLQKLLFISFKVKNVSFFDVDKRNFKISVSHFASSSSKAFNKCFQRI